MTDPRDETERTPTPPQAAGLGERTESTSAEPAMSGPAGADATGADPSSADPTGADPTGVHATSLERPNAQPAVLPRAPAAEPPPLRADPDRPADPGWREPPWFPARPRDRRPSLVALLVGLALIGIGLWLFIDRTLGIALPDISWRSLWPVLLIGLGAIILVRSLSRRG